MLSPAVLMLFPTVLNSLHSTDAILHMYWCYPLHLLMLSPTFTDAIPPQYWTASAVLNSIRSTEPTLDGVITVKLAASFSEIIHWACCEGERTNQSEGQRVCFFSCRKAIQTVTSLLLDYQFFFKPRKNPGNFLSYSKIAQNVFPTFLKIFWFCW